MKTTITNDREIFDTLKGHESLKKLKPYLDTALGRPLWWLSFKMSTNPKQLKQYIRCSQEIWSDTRAKNLRSAASIARSIKKHSKLREPFRFADSEGKTNYCLPLVVDDRVVGYFGLHDLKKTGAEPALNFLALAVRLAVENCSKTEELNRLSASIRPRAIALSTVHTVHRIINSTLNLDELVSRLAHLTAQVLRVNRCAIYLVSDSTAANGAAPSKRQREAKALTCKALVGYPKGRDKSVRVLFGQGVEGRVAKTAEILFRKKMISLPLIDEDVIGVMTISYKKDKKDFSYFDLEILTTLSEEAVIAIKNAQLYEEQKRVTLGTIQSLAVILGTRVPNAFAPEVFLRLVLRVGQELKLNEEEMQALHYATLLKDTARVGIPDEILKKPTKLTGEEYQLLRDHPIKGAKIVQSFESLKPVAPIILYSREKFDGSGYPEGLKGEKIPLGARILAVISAFEAIMIGRPYRDQSTLTEALDEISRNSGTQFDPKVVDAFIRIVEKEGFNRFLKNAS